MPQPITTARAFAGKFAHGVMLLLVLSWSVSEDGADRALEGFDVAAHDRLGAGASPSQIACSSSPCSVTASSSRATRSSARNQIRSVSV